MRYIRLLLPVFPLLLFAVALLVFFVLNPDLPVSLTPWKDVFLMLLSGILTLSGAYASSIVQGQLEIDRETRALHREQTKPYREYLYWLMELIQRSETVRSFTEERIDMPNQGRKLRLSESDREDILAKMPPIWERAVLDNPGVSEQISATFDLGRKFVTQRDELDEDAALSLKKSCLETLKILSKYEKTA